MTNAEKYLKDEVSIEELIFDIINFEKCWNRKAFDKEVKRIKKFFFTSSKPILTEDERVILRNLDKKYTYIARTCGDIWVLVGEESENSDCDVLTPFNHLFQFIKERRRIRDSRTFERRIRNEKNNKTNNGIQRGNRKRKYFWNR